MAVAKVFIKTSKNSPKKKQKEFKKYFDEEVESKRHSILLQ